MKAFCQRCGAQVENLEARAHPECLDCVGLNEKWTPNRIVQGRASQTGQGSIPETARRQCWWTKAAGLVISREQYAGN